MKTKIQLMVAFLLLTNIVKGQTEIFVSPKGKDTWPGTLKKPFQTIAKAKQTVRERLENSNEDITVYLRGGEYFVDETLNFSAKDGGTDNQTVSYKAYQTEKPVLTGGKRIRGWTADKDGIYKVSVEGMGFRQLYVNNSRAIRAREPNQGEYNKLIGWDLNGRHLIMEGSQVSNWQNFNQVEAVIQMFWAEAIVHLKSVEKFRAGTHHAYVSIKDEQADILFPRPFPQKQDNAAFHFENAYEFIDQANEWYLDRQAQTLYFKPEEGADIASLEIIAPVTETLINIEGTLDDPVKNLAFEGLVFKHANWDLPSSNGFINAQAGMYNLTAREDNYQTVRRPGAAIRVKNAHQIQFGKNLFQHMGITAIDFVAGTKNCAITANVIRSIAGSGIMVGAFLAEPDGEYHVPYNPSDLREVSTGDEISNNYIYNVACDYYGTCPVAAGYPAEIKITHNRIKDVPYCGISLCYGWTSEPNAMHDNLVANNHISNAMNLICDGGSIYTLSLQPGTKITENYIDNMKRSATAGVFPVAHLYLDEQSGGTLERPFVMERNCMSRTDKSVQQWNLHKEGIVLLIDNSVYPLKDVIEKAGIEPEFKPVIEELLKK
jgi:hypothetical protein